MTERTILDVEAIRRRLPHRFPFLLLDRVLELGPEHIRALKNVTINEPFFAGHFPEKPIMPAVLVFEAMAQAVGLMHQETYPTGLGFLVGVDEARVRRMVVPGDRLVFEARLLRQRQRMCKAQVSAHVDDALAAEAVITLISEADAGED